MAGDQQPESRALRALGSSVRGNSTAFGFSIMITLTFGAVQSLRGTPSLAELVLFGLGAALAVGAFEAAVTRGFRESVEKVSERADMLGTALNFASVAGAVGAAIGIAELVGGVVIWPLAPAVAATVYVLVEAAEIFVAERLEGEEGGQQPST
jgi:hypothetical protein